MKAKVALLAHPEYRRCAMLFAGLSLVSLVLPSMDQCTRGPSVTAMVLTNLHWLL